MENIPGHIQTGFGLINTNPNNFSLTELSFLIEILDRITIADVYTGNRTIRDLLVEGGEEILLENDLSPNDLNILVIHQKLDAFLNYFENVIRHYQIHLNDNVDRMNRNEKLRFLNKRLVDYKQLNNDYVQVVNNHGLDINQLPTAHQQIGNNIPDTLRNIENSEFNQLIRLLQPISQKEKNLFLFYKLHVLVRTLIKSFIQSMTLDYITLFNRLNFFKENGDEEHLQVSILEYIFSFDEYELSANRIYVLLTNYVTIFNLYPNFVVTNQAGNNVILPNLIQTLQHEETTFRNLLQIRCRCEFNPSYENDVIFHRYLPLIYKFTKSTDRTPTIAPEHFGHFSAFQIGPNRYNLYRLYYSQYVHNNEDLKVKLQEYYINPQLIEQMNRQFNDNTLQYNDELTKMDVLWGGEEEEGDEMAMKIPPQTREVILKGMRN
ncbi:hypothetical protein Mgra_00009652 [Meloidogyne graminicola]|uniref:Uncharacterized protein n=1 Tax=Meloidogyne graminicola TaxID=189291 RepID=A0A8S9ZD10_9BILA|nr:hypothetical protein Mgra_00009652 [Meloidogyne graminicola]